MSLIWVHSTVWWRREAGYKLFFFKRKEKWGQLGDFSKMGVTCLHDDDKESSREGISDDAEERR